MIGDLLTPPPSWGEILRLAWTFLTDDSEFPDSEPALPLAR